MGQEVSHSHFSQEEFSRYQQHLEEETALFLQQFAAGKFSSKPPVGGFEIEAWLLDDAMRPAPINQTFFEHFNNPLATPELATFNIELNNTPLPIRGDCFKQWSDEFHCLLNDADNAAKQLSAHLTLIGTLPTLEASDCCIENMSAMKRYKALNESILKARHNHPLSLDIKGKAHLQLTPDSVMMEAATTSFQIHLQTPYDLAHHYYNASIIASAPLIAISGNSPFLFNKQLWQETRIPLFEQSVHTGTGLQRVSFGTGYAEQSIGECFSENLHAYPVLLPMLFEDEPGEFNHLRLHNGVIWRWNRPLVGFDADGTPHIRIEQRILPAGPTVEDMMANAAFFYGLTHSLMTQHHDQEKMPFSQARHNFYDAAKNGMDASLQWNNAHYSGGKLQALLLDELLPQAQQGLQALTIDQAAIDHYLEIIAARIESKQTGANWQIQHKEKVNGDMQQLTKDYLLRQRTSLPVHTWD